MSTFDNAKSDSPTSKNVPAGDSPVNAIETVESTMAEMEGLLEQAELPDRDPTDFDTVEIFGLPLARITFDQTVDLVDYLIRLRKPGFFITANLHYAMLTDRHPELPALNKRAHFIIADGAPMVWYSRLGKKPLPERVTGSDLIYRLCERAAKRGYRLFFLGGAPGIADEAARELRRLYPGLQIVGIEAPSFRGMSPKEHDELIHRIRQAEPDLLFAALGQPKGELWMDKNCDDLGVPVMAQIGASFDFVAGKINRAPRWMQRTGLEWFYRITREPKRMIPRYFGNALFLMKTVLRDAFGVFRRRRRKDRT